MFDDCTPNYCVISQFPEIQKDNIQSKKGTMTEELDFFKVGLSSNTLLKQIIKLYYTIIK